MAKVYIVSNTNEGVGYEQDFILTVFSTKEKAKDFFNTTINRILERNKGINVRTDKDNDTYFFAETDNHYWYEVMIIEKELN